MTRLVARECGCVEDYYGGQKRPERCECGNRLLTEAQLNPPARKPLKRVSARNREKVRKQRGTLKPGRGMAASPAQQAKVRNLPCIVCGRDRHEGVEIQAAHVYPRRFATCDCAEGVVPICAGDHALYEAKEIDLLPLLLTRGYRRELVHAIVEHDAPPMRVMEIVTGVAWEPKPSNQKEAVALAAPDRSSR